eukprot:6711765-Prymnesium_polylepis.1
MAEMGLRRRSKAQTDTSESTPWFSSTTFERQRGLYWPRGSGLSSALQCQTSALSRSWSRP